MALLAKFGTIDFTANVIDWQESAPKRTNPQTTPRKDGVTLSEDPTYEARDVSVPIRVTGATADAALTALDAIVNNFPSARDKLYKYTDRYLNAYFIGVENLNFAGSIGDVIECNLRFLADDPYYYTATPVQDSQTGKIQGNTFVVNNTGLSIVFPTMTFRPSGGSMTSLKITNTTSAPTLPWAYQGTVVAGQDLIANFEKKTLTNNGVNALDGWKTVGGTAASWLWLQAGNNTIEVTTLTPNNPPTLAITTAFTPRWS